MTGMHLRREPRLKARASSWAVGDLHRHEFNIQMRGFDSARIGTGLGLPVLLTLTSAWGSETRIRSCGEAVVLVDKPAEQVPAANIARTDRDRLPGRCERWSEANGAMGAPAVAVCRSA